jgi:hypothetical protein
MVDFSSRNILVYFVDLCGCLARRELNDDNSYLRDERGTLNNQQQDER